MLIVKRLPFFITLFIGVLLIIFVPKLIWLSTSRKTQGIFAFEGMGNAGDALKRDYSIVFFKLATDTIWFNGTGNLHFKAGQSVPIRYNPSSPADAKIDVFESIWGDSLIYFAIAGTIILMVFLHPDVVPKKSSVVLGYKKPFIWLG